MQKVYKFLILISLTLLTIYLINVNKTFVYNVVVFIVDIITPIFLGFVIAFLLYPLSLLLRKKFNKKVSNCLAFIIFILILLIIVLFIIPKMFDQFIGVMEELPELIDLVTDKLNSKVNGLFKKILDYLNIKIKLSEVLKTQSESIKKIVIELSGNFIKGIITFVISIIISAYILIDYENFVVWIKRKTIKNKKLYNILREIKKVMYSYFRGVLFVFILMFIISLIIFQFMQIKYPILMSFVFAITNLIPYIGPYIGGIFVALLSFCDSILKGCLSIGIVVVLQVLESYVITPKIQSKMLKVKPFFVLIFAIILGKLLGIFGVVISIPILAILHVIFEQILFKKSE